MLLDKILPPMNSQEQKKFLRQTLKWADEDSRKEALIDPLSRIPRA